MYILRRKKKAKKTVLTPEQMAYNVMYEFDPENVVQKSVVDIDSDSKELGMDFIGQLIKILFFNLNYLLND